MTITIPYKPTDKQLELHEDPTRFKVAVWGRRSGKSTFAINEAAKTCVMIPNSKVWIVTPIFNQAKDIYWRGADMLNKYLVPQLYNKKNDSELLVEFKNGSILQFKGADRPEVMRGSALDLIVLDEVAEFRYGEDTWESILLPSLSDKQGKAIFIGTPRGENFFYKLFLRGLEDNGLWKSWKIKTEDSGNPWTLTQEGKMELSRLKQEMSPQMYAQEYECDFTVPIQGAYYASQIIKAEEEGRIGFVPFDPKLLVDTFWDLGVGDAMAIGFFQRTGKEVRMIDYFEASGEGLPYYAKILQDKGYVYGDHFAPHDIEVREMGSGRSRKEIALSLGIRFRVVPNISFEDGIEAGRLIFNRLWINREKCSQFISSIRNYHKEYDEKNKIFKDKPVHDWSSHAADMYRYMAVGYKEIKIDNNLGFVKYTVPINALTQF